MQHVLYKSGDFLNNELLLLTDAMRRRKTTEKIHKYPFHIIAHHRRTSELVKIASMKKNNMNF